MAIRKEAILPKEREAGRFAARIAAELIVIIAGVMIALWADARVADRAERRAEASRLEALQLNIDTTLVELRGLAERIEFVQDRLRMLLAADGGGTLPSEDSLREAFAVGFLDVPGFEPQLDVYDDLRSSGELALLDDVDVRRALSALDAARESLAVALKDLGTVQQLNFDPFLIRQVDLPPLLAWAAGSGQANANRIAELIPDREFRNLVVLKLDLFDVLENATERMEAALNRLDVAVGARLQRLR